MTKDQEYFLKAPFPYFGGKSTVANKIWDALGDVAHYIEPFFGSGAVLLLRPDYDCTRHIETINDSDGFICNVWRALKYSPEETAEYCDWPVNHIDLMARRRVLLKNEKTLFNKLVENENYHDVKLAGYWIWAAGCWIGGGLTSPKGIPHLGSKGKGVHKISLCGRPHLSDKGVGVHKISLCQIPHLTGKGKGVHKISLCQRPHLGDKGKGVHKISLCQRPHLGNKGVGVHKIALTKGNNNNNNIKNNIYKWFNTLSERLRRVRVVCGNWDQVCGGNWQDNEGICGIYFDPPYGVLNRDSGVYSDSSIKTFIVSHDVRDWCIDRGKNKRYRIVLSGYEEHMELLDYGWTCENWKAQGGYSNQDKSKKNQNRKREMIYYSPHCINNINKNKPKIKKSKYKIKLKK